MSDSKQSDKVSTAVIGMGYWGRHYVRICSSHPGTSLTAMCDALPAAVEKQKALHPTVAGYTSVADMLKNESIQCAIVATQASTHFEVVKELLEAGVHVMCEKPLTTKIEDAKGLEALARKKNLTLMVGHTFLFNNGILKMKELIDTGSVGKVYAVAAQRTNLGPFRDDVNCVWDLATHDISIFVFLFGEPEWVSAHGAKPLGHKNEDVAFITIGYKDGLLINLHCSWADPSKVRLMNVIGSKRRVEFNDMKAPDSITIYERGVEIQESNRQAMDAEQSYASHLMTVHHGGISIPHIGSSEPLSAQVSHFVKCLGQQSFKSDAAFSVSVVKVLVAAELSMAKQSMVRLEDV